MENLYKMGSVKHQFVFCWIWAIVISTSMCSNQSDARLPDTCSVMPFFSATQVDVVCDGELPDFSRMDFPHTPYVYELVLTKCDFEVVPKKAFQGLTGMQRLFVNCEDSGTYPELRFEEGSFQDLPKLKMILISGSTIRHLPHGFFCHLQTLDQLFLGNNSIISTELLGFGDAADCSSSRCTNRVEILKLAENSITELKIHTFCYLTNLLYLDVSFNSLRSIEEDAFYNLGSLRGLDLSDNNLTGLPETTLKPLTGLYALDLANNPNFNISGFLQYVPHLKGLFLPGTGLEFLDKDSFQGLSRLESLMLYDNRLHAVHEDVFEPLVGIVDDADSGTEVTVCEDEDVVNRLVFGGDFFSYNEHQAKVVNATGLRYLNLNGNNLTVMPPIGKLFKLLVFTMARNQIEMLDDGDFSNLRRLQILTLSFNRIPSISHRLFANLHCLRQLFLDHNAIGHISGAAFHGLTALSILHLQHNRIKDIGGIFGKNENLTVINLSYNYLEALSLEMLPSDLISLDVSHNLIKFLSYTPGSLPRQSQMYALNLSHNQIDTIVEPFFPMSLVNLHLDHNLIKSISSCMFCKLGTLANVTLNDNRLQTIHPDDLRVNSMPLFPHYPNLFLSGNDFVCNCQLQDMAPDRFSNDVSYTHLRIDNFKTLSCRREYAKNKPVNVLLVQAIPPEDFLCRISHDSDATVPEGCSVYHDASWDYVIVDCSGAKLTLIPSEISPGVRKLYLDGNHFSKLGNTTFQAQVHVNLTELYLNSSHVEFIEDSVFVHLVNLKRLHLEHNALVRLSKDTFAGLDRLVELRLSHNNLMMMEDKIFSPLSNLRQLRLSHNQLRTFPVWELDKFGPLSSVSLSENPWSCECVYVQMYREWLQASTTQVLDLDVLFCKFETNSSLQVPLIAFNTSHCLHLIEPSFLNSMYFKLVVGLIVSLGSFSIACLILYLYRKEMQVIIYSRYGVRLFHRNNGQNIDGEKMFDAFICYSYVDEDFVVEQLLPNIEGIEPPFRCCIHQRDFLVGGLITDNILEAVSKSRRSILVLTEAFISSEWCRFEFKTAYVQMLNDKCNRVIVIVVGKVPEKLDPEMKLYLKTNTYISWGDKLFWERLYFAMPDRVQMQELTHNAQ